MLPIPPNLGNQDFTPLTYLLTNNGWRLTCEVVCFRNFFRSMVSAGETKTPKKSLGKMTRWDVHGTWMI